MTLLIAAAMAWSGWLWLPTWSTAWWLAELPAAVLVVGWLLRDRPLAMSAYLTRIATTDRAPRWPGLGGGESLPAPTPVTVPTEQADPLPPGVVSLDDWRERRAA